MGSGITATNLAGSIYDNYIFTNSSNGQKYASSVSESDLAEKFYGVSNLSNALSSLGETADNDGITTVDAFAKNYFNASQSSVYNIASRSFDAGMIAGSAASYANASVLANNTVAPSAANTYQYYNYSSSYFTGSLLNTAA